MIDLDLLEKTFILMEKHLVDEIQCEQFTIRKTKFKGEKVAPSESELLATHLKQAPTEPWNDIPADIVDNWAMKGNG
jgi:hypothetical protein